MIDISSELQFQTARSGGKGGQNVNKVETMVMARWKVEASVFFNEEDKKMITQKLRNNISSSGELIVKSQAERSQLLNRETVIRKINLLVNNAVARKKKRLKTAPTKRSVENRLQNKKLLSAKKQERSYRHTD